MMLLTEQVFTRLTKRVNADLSRAAKRASQTPSAFIRDAILEKIQRDLK